VIIPVRDVVFSMIALVATVVPWTIRAMSSGLPSSAATFWVEAEVWTFRRLATHLP